MGEVSANDRPPTDGHQALKDNQLEAAAIEKSSVLGLALISFRANGFSSFLGRPSNESWRTTNRTARNVNNNKINKLFRRTVGRYPKVGFSYLPVAVGQFDTRSALSVRCGDAAALEQHPAVPQPRKAHAYQIYKYFMFPRGCSSFSTSSSVLYRRCAI